MNFYLRMSALFPQTDTNVLNEKYGVRLNTGAGGIYTAIIPMEQLRTFARDSTVMNIDASTEVRMMMDSVRIYTNIDPAFVGKRTFTLLSRGRNYYRNNR